MAHAAFAQLLTEYQPTPAEAAFKPQMLQLLSDYPDCFDRSCIPPGHFTASCWLVGFNGTKALLTHHRILNRWLQLGGHADGNSDLLDAALREAREESGLRDIYPLLPGIFDIDIHDIPANPKKAEAAHRHYDVRFLLYTPQNEFDVSEESLDLGWFDPAQLDSMPFDDAVIRLKNKWQDLYKNGQLAQLIEECGPTTGKF